MQRLKAANIQSLTQILDKVMKETMTSKQSDTSESLDEEIDKILDKISQSGYESLSKEEKQEVEQWIYQNNTEETRMTDTMTITVKCKTENQKSTISYILHQNLL